MLRSQIRLAAFGLLLSLHLACGVDPLVATFPFDQADTGVDIDDHLDADPDGASDDGNGELGDPVDAANPDAGTDGRLEDSGDADAGDGDAGDASDATDVRPDPGPLEPFTTCLDTPFVFTPSGSWEHSIATPLIAWQQPGHSVEDRLATLPWETYEIEGKFAYGVFGNDLEDEWVRAWIDTCVAWEALGRARTDSDGRVRFEVPRDALPGPGRYALRMAVEVDGSLASGTLLVVPQGAQLVVFDIDGTLTTGDSELFSDYFSDLFGGSYVPEAYTGAVDVVRAYVDAGWEVLYLTGRPYWLDRITREWLDHERFPLGTLHLTRTLSESWPSNGGVGDYKRAWLEGILAQHDIFRAYGNATTDIYAYRQAGIDLAETFIIGEHAGAEGTQPVSSYPEHRDAVLLPTAIQPWLE
jgi:hypothetical protein